MFELDDVLRGVDKPELLDEWAGRLPVLEAQRAAVEAFIDGGGQAYGFTTLFGHLDSIHREREAIGNLFEGHLVGAPEHLDPAWARGMLAVKLCQLANGGSGISPGTYQRLLGRFTGDLRDVRIDLRASYGSGDVVPGAWFVEAMLGGAEDLPAGDLMALINGAYVPTGLLLGSLTRVRTVFNEALHVVGEAAEFAGAHDAGVQLPVSLRDTSPLECAVAQGKKQLETALGAALNRQSSNPLFTFEGEAAAPRSNSSFLDFELSLAIGVAHEALRVSSAYLTGATRFVAGLGEEAAPELDKPFFVQLPKVSKAYADGLGVPGVSYAQAESHGVEDIGDAGLIRARAFLGDLEPVAVQTDLLRDALHKARAT